MSRQNDRNWFDDVMLQTKKSFLFESTEKALNVRAQHFATCLSIPSKSSHLPITSSENKECFILNFLSGPEMTRPDTRMSSSLYP